MSRIVTWRKLAVRSRRRKSDFLHDFDRIRASIAMIRNHLVGHYAPDRKNRNLKLFRISCPRLVDSKFRLRIKVKIVERQRTARNE